MIAGIGVDIVELNRLEIIIKEKPSFIERILTKSEKEIFDRYNLKRQIEFLGGRFAAKEAFSKAFGTGIGKVSFHDLEILNASNGKPVLRQNLFEGNVFVSISHTDLIATAYIVLEYL